MGLIGKFRDLPGCTTFYFRVRTPKGYAFDTAHAHAQNLHDAFDAVKRAYPGAEVSALNETQFDIDGLPKLNPTVRKEHARI